MPGKKIQKGLKKNSGAQQSKVTKKDPKEAWSTEQLEKKAEMRRRQATESSESNSPLQKKDACYAKVKARYKKWPSAYASGALVKCRKVGAKNWGNKSK